MPLPDGKNDAAGYGPLAESSVWKAWWAAVRRIEIKYMGTVAPKINFVGNIPAYMHSHGK